MSRRRDIEFLRIVATFLVVWYHCPSDLPEFAYSGLIFFVIASTYFSVIEASAGEYVSGRRVGRLLSIWLVWYLVYVLISVLDGKINAYLHGPIGTMFLVGPAVHLWYLPFLAVVLIASPKIAMVLKRPALLAVVGAIFALSMVSVDVWRPWANALGVPWAQYIHALPAVFVGVLFVAVRNHAWQVRVGSLVVALLCTLPARQAVGVGGTYFAGIVLASPILLALPQGWLIDKISALSKYMLGIYLIHPLAIRVARRLLEVENLWLATAGFFISLGVVMTLYSRVPRLAKAVM